ncbi:MAG: EAL and HDOD domain-containing protein [Terriglobales bacterium]
MEAAENSAPVKMVARQPILDRGQRVFGYELLFRPEAGVNYCRNPRPEATAELIGDGLMLHDWIALAGGGRAFVNLTRADLLAGHARALPQGATVIEILETVTPDEETLHALRALRVAGYVLALDDVCDVNRLAPFAGIAQLAKVDLELTSPQQRVAILRTLRALSMSAVAEKVATRPQFREAAALGFDYFQGYFFARPELLQRHDLSAGQWSRIRLLQELRSSVFDVGKLDELIRNDLAFAYKLLRYLNSSTFGFGQPINSTRHAITLLGENEVRRWACMIGLTDLAGGQSPEMALTAVRRAVFCEQLGAALGMEAERLFLIGLFSLLDAILDQPRQEIVRQLPLDRDLEQALLGMDTPMGLALQLAEAYDHADWERAAVLTAALGISDAQFHSVAMTAVARSQEIMAHQVAAPAATTGARRWN